jgi:predicted O-methyltransferase YrrM
MDLSTPFHQAVQSRFRMSAERISSDNMPVLVRRGTRGTLAGVFADLGFIEGAEIGTMVGSYARVLCENNPNLHLYCIDPWVACGHLSQRRQNRRMAEAVKNLEPYNVTIVRKFSMQALNDFEDGSLDFVYIDGAHDFDNVCMDLIFWVPKVKNGGVIALHDYMAGHGAGVMKAVDGYTHCHKILPWYVTREREATAFWENIQPVGYKGKIVLRP